MTDRAHFHGSDAALLYFLCVYWRYLTDSTHIKTYIVGAPLVHSPMQETRSFLLLFLFASQVPRYVPSGFRQCAINFLVCTVNRTKTLSGTQIVPGGSVDPSIYHLPRSGLSHHSMSRSVLSVKNKQEKRSYKSTQLLDTTIGPGRSSF